MSAPCRLFDEFNCGGGEQDEINTILWKACDTFRGTIDPSEYKNTILVTVFVKYISDGWLLWSCHRGHFGQ